MPSDFKGALIGAVCTLLGSLSGGGISVYTTHMTAQAQSKENQVNFVREQQQSIYTKAVADSNKLQELELQCQPSTPRAQHPTADSLDSALSTLRDDGPTVELIGSKNAFFEFGHVVDSHEKVIAACTDPNALPKALDASKTDITTFIAQARTDVQGS